MRIAYVFMQFPAPRQTFAVREVRAVMGLGHQVQVFCLRKPHQKFFELMQFWKLKHHMISYPSPEALWQDLLFALKHFRAFLSVVMTLLIDNWQKPAHLFKALAILPAAAIICRQIHLSGKKVDLVHLFWGHYPAVLGLLLKQIDRKLPVTMFLGAYDLTTYFKSSVRLAGLADAVFTHSRANVPLLEILGIAPAKICVVYRGIPHTLIEEEFPKKRPGSIACVAALESSKGVEKVCDVFRMVRRQRADVSLEMIGDGPMREQLEKSFRNDQIKTVHFRGYLPSDRVLDVLREAQIFLFLSEGEYERLPNSIKEAMAKGCVVIVSRTPGIEELVKHGVSGFVIPDHDLAKVALQVIEVLDRPSIGKEMFSRAKETLQEHFVVERNVCRYVSVWQRAIGATT